MPLEARAVSHTQRERERERINGTFTGNLQHGRSCFQLIRSGIKYRKVDRIPVWRGRLYDSVDRKA